MVSDFSKKKRANRSAKLKQCKLDARREQWLSQVNNNKGCKEVTDNVREQLAHARNESNDLFENHLGMGQRGDERDGLIRNYHHDSDSEFITLNSPSSACSVFGSNASGTNFSSSSSSSSRSSRGCCSGSITEEEEEDNDGCLDDWEAVADALAADDKSQTSSPDPHHEPEPLSRSGSSCGSGNPQDEISRSKSVKVLRAGQAWRLDDAFRPESLPNLSKQHSFPMNSNRHYGIGTGGLAYSSSMTVPLSCPICYEDLDMTDSSFCPCSCGFRLCLFCHKRIIEEDGRCPGCRKPYENGKLVEGEASFNGGNFTFHLARSYSMITRA